MDGAGKSTRVQLQGLVQLQIATLFPSGQTFSALLSFSVFFSPQLPGLLSMALRVTLNDRSALPRGKFSRLSRPPVGPILSAFVENYRKRQEYVTSCGLSLVATSAIGIVFTICAIEGQVSVELFYISALISGYNLELLQSWWLQL